MSAKTWSFLFIEIFIYIFLNKFNLMTQRLNLEQFNAQELLQLKQGF